MIFMKSLGAIIFVMSFSSIGILKSYKTINSVKVLSEYKTLLLTLKRNINFSQFSIQEIIMNEYDDFSKKIKFEKNWQNKNLAELVSRIFIFEADKKYAEEFFRNLGHCDIQEEIIAIDFQIKYVDERIKEEKDILKEKTKLNITIYLFVAVAIVLVII